MSIFKMYVTEDVYFLFKNKPGNMAIMSVVYMYVFLFANRYHKQLLYTLYLN